MNPIQRILRLFAAPRDPRASTSTGAAATRREAPAVALLELPGWQPYDNGQTIGRAGSEGGTILCDLENASGARITLERLGESSPFAVTFGIYGLMVHTHFCKEQDEGLAYMKGSAWGMEQVFHLYDTPEGERDAAWQEEHDRLLSDLTA
ncbi:hypothetical protein [Flaviaesturariibacter terrae]